MKLFSVKNIVVSSVFGSFLMFGQASAQNATQEYRQWQDAQRDAQREYYQYQRTRRPDDYRDWQRAQQRVQREQIEYQRANRMYNAGNGVGYGYGRVNRTRNYRIYRNGSYYEVDNRGADLLRQAVNQGYQQGYRQGQVDRQYGRGGDYNGSTYYRSGTYGYQSYVDRSQYQYYFREGFQRGYQDGYNSRNQYGYRSGNSWNILGTVLNSILNITQN